MNNLTSFRWQILCLGYAGFFEGQRHFQKTFLQCKYVKHLLERFNMTQECPMVGEGRKYGEQKVTKIVRKEIALLAHALQDTESTSFIRAIQNWG